MKAIHYAGDVVVTGDAIAEAVVDYAGALARRESAAEITIPVRTAEGGTAEARMLLGPASQLVVGPAPDGAEELEDPELVATLLRFTRELAPTTAHEVDDASKSRAVEDYGITEEYGI